jgi:hypothetical protein
MKDHHKVARRIDSDFLLGEKSPERSNCPYMPLKVM